ncbi:hypothetical protein ACC691_39955, partial [Rhizobium johnstonii]|uniref:hypothetical protein n=1 Tax=Rhizobium johnstonii TaxID=3019933 RepID=UPI003F9DB6B5
FYGLKDLPEAAPLLAKLGTYTEGAGCIYAKKLDDLDLDVLHELIAIAWARGDDPEPIEGQLRFPRREPGLGPVAAVSRIGRGDV